MLTSRQINILKFLELKDEYIKGSELASSLDISTKTLQKDIKELNEFLEDYELKITSKTSKGYYLEGSDINTLNMLLKNFTGNFNDPYYRIQFILEKLVNNDYVKKEDLADELFVSSSSISNDIKEVRNIVLEFNLSLESKAKYGLYLSGSEIDLRKLIVKRNLMIDRNSFKKLLDDVTYISSLVFSRLKLNLNDTTFKNIVLYLIISVKRLASNHVIEKIDNYQSLVLEERAAKQIFDFLKSSYDINVSVYEINYLAILIHYHSNPEVLMTDDSISLLIDNIFTEIKQRLNYDFSYDMELHLSLSSHIGLLLKRAKYGIQLQNDLLDEVKTRYLFAYEAALITARYLNKTFDIKIIDDEIAYIAIHYLNSVEKNIYNSKAKRILIISSTRAGQSLLMKQSLLRRFNKLISDIDVINLLELERVNLDDYDVIFSTFVNNDQIPSRAIKISYFFNEKDFINIETALLETDFSTYLIKYFKEDLFLTDIKEKEKNKILLEMVKKIHEDDPSIDAFTTYDEVLKREELGFTCFDNLIAFPHPNRVLFDKTYVCVAVLEKAIDYGEKKAQIIIMVIGNKNSDSDIKLFFDFVQKLVGRKDMVERITKNRSYSEFINCLKELY